MQLSVEGGDLDCVLSRALDQVRRLNLTILSVHATVRGTGVDVRLGISETDLRTSATLRERILHIPTVRSAVYGEQDVQASSPICPADVPARCS